MQIRLIATFLLFSGFFTPAGADERCRPVITPTPEEEEKAPLPEGEEIQEGDIEFSSDTGEWSLHNGNTWLKKAHIRQGNRQITADEAQYDAESGTFRVKGDVDYRDDQVRVRGSSGNYDAKGGARFKDAEFELPLRPARGGADEILVTPQGRITLQKVQYTTCPPDDQDWVLKASDITLDTQTRNGTGKGVRLDFKGVPILYTPIISFPLGNERKSGFLFPDFGHSSRSGIELSVPYYFNLAPNYDLTLTPRLLSQRGAELGEEFRYLSQRQRGSLLGSYLPGDDLRNSDRSLVQWNHRTNFTREWRLNIDAANASDENYFEDFGMGAEGTSVTYLERNAQLEHYGRHWTLLAQTQNFQTIDQTIPHEVRPYSRLPRLVGRGLWDNLPGGFTSRLDSELVYFYRSLPGSEAALQNLPNGARLDFYPEFSWSFDRPGLYVTPALGYRHTQYRLDDGPAGMDTSHDRGAPIGSLDAGMIFERPQGKHANRLQTLEPRLLYLYVPFRDQTDLPIFDTGLPDLNLIQLFRRNRYVGADRLSDANQLSFGVTSRLLEGDTGQQYLSATIGQTYYFDSPRVTLPNETPQTRETSNLISQLTLTAYRNWNVNLANEWNPSQSRSERGELSLQYRPDPDRVANIGYRFRRDLLEQVDGSVAWPIAGSWKVFARSVYSLDERSLIEQFAGFEYASCCWRLRLVQRRYVSDRSGQRDSSIALQLELNGLSSVGVPADAFLKHSIRGYSPRESDATP